MRRPWQSTTPPETRKEYIPQDGSVRETWDRTSRVHAVLFASTLAFVSILPTFACEAASQVSEHA